MKRTKHKNTARLALAAATTTVVAFGGMAAASAVKAPASGGPSASASSARANAPMPDTEALRAQTRSLDDLASTLRPVADLLEAVLRADGGKLTAGQANQHTAAVREALPDVRGEAASSAPRTAEARAELQAAAETLIAAATEDQPDTERVKRSVSELVSSATQALTVTAEATAALAPVAGEEPE